MRYVVHTFGHHLCVVAGSLEAAQTIAAVFKTCDGLDTEISEETASEQYAKQLACNA